MKLEIMDLQKEREQGTAGTTQWVKTAEGQRFSVIVLSEMEESERVGRVCRALKYRPKLVHRSNDADLSAAKVFDLTADPIIKDAEEASNEQHVCRICGAEHTCRADLELHMGDHKIGRKDSGVRSRLDKNKKNRGHDGEVQTSSDQTGSNPKSSIRGAPFPHSNKYVCNLCGREYVSKSKLVSHMRIHTGETPYTCKICGKGFRRSDWLANHMKVHKEQRPDQNKKQYACDRCERTYRSKVSLGQHLRKHTGERPYPCAICLMRFLDKGSLGKHLKCHSDDRPFVCSECGHSFKHSHSLKKHKRIHTGEKPYSCSFCGKKFPYKHSLTMHAKSSRCKRSRHAKVT